MPLVLLGDQLLTTDGWTDRETSLLYIYRRKIYIERGGEGGRERAREMRHLPGNKLQYKLQTSSVSNSIPQIILKDGMASNKNILKLHC